MVDFTFTRFKREVAPPIFRNDAKLTLIDGNKSKSTLPAATNRWQYWLCAGFPFC